MPGKRPAASSSDVSAVRFTGWNSLVQLSRASQRAEWQEYHIKSMNQANETQGIPKQTQVIHGACGENTTGDIPLSP
jgi:hypothetical protein